MVYASLARRRVVRKAPQREAGAVAAAAVHPCTRPPDAPARRERGSRLAEAVEVLPPWSSVPVGRAAAVGLRPVPETSARMSERQRLCGCVALREQHRQVLCGSADARGALPAIAQRLCAAF